MNKDFGDQDVIELLVKTYGITNTVKYYNRKITNFASSMSTAAAENNPLLVAMHSANIKRASEMLTKITALKGAEEQLDNKK